MDSFMRKLQERRIDSKYSIMSKIGEGGQGTVYLGEDLDTHEQVALKLVNRCDDPSRLREEVELYGSLEGLTGFPEMYSYCSIDDYQVMVFELLGPSLEDLFVFCECQFSLKTTLLLLDQLLVRFEALHTKGLLHRDVKPRNCLLGTGKNGNVVYLTDFGLSGVVLAPRKVEDLPPTHSCLVGTARFASINGHSGGAECEKDDLESLGYMVLYFLRGKLPWQGLKAHGRDEKERLVQEKKEGLNAADLCSGLPHEFFEYMEYVRSSPREGLPDYEKLRKKFREAARRERIEYDNVFDWTVRMHLLQQEESIRHH